MSRYLTPMEKADILRKWKQQRETARPDGDPGGHGCPDPEVFRLCKTLNGIDGLCTIQSCCGHKTQAADGSGEHLYPGCLWLRLDERMTRRFKERVMELGSSSPPIESVNTFYMLGTGHEVVEILFHGMERGRYHDSARVIREFFASCAAEVTAESGVASARLFSFRCSAKSKNNYSCTRTIGHHGFHESIHRSGSIIDQWPNERPEPGGGKR